MSAPAALVNMKPCVQRSLDEGCQHTSVPESQNRKDKGGEREGKGGEGEEDTSSILFAWSTMLISFSCADIGNLFLNIYGSSTRALDHVLPTLLPACSIARH